MHNTHYKIYCPSTNSTDKQSKLQSITNSADKQSKVQSVTSKKKDLKPITLTNFFPSKYITKKQRDLSTEYIKFQQTNNLYQKVRQIRFKQAKPKLNLLFIETEKNMLEFKQRIRDIRNKEIIDENSKYRHRVFSKKSAFCRNPLFGKEYEKMHDQLLTKIIKKEMPKLPKIKKKVILKCDTEVKLNDSAISKSEESFDLNQQTQGKKHRTSEYHEYNRSSEDIKGKDNNNSKEIIKIKCDELNQSNESKENENNKKNE